MKKRTRIIAGVAVLALSVLGAVTYFLGTFGARHGRTGPYPELGPADPEATAFFSPSYALARDRFLEAADAAGATVESFEHPLLGIDGEPLFTDVALIGPSDAASFLVLVSGTHGVEGYAGSGVQTGVLSEGIASRRPDGVSLLLVHALNPHGFSHLRRFTEDNVDLNRNCRDHSIRAKPNLDYAEVADLMAPQSLSFLSEARAWASLAWLMKVGGMDRQSAVIRGQHEFSQGLFYGGTAATWSNRTLHAVMERYLSLAERVVVVDLHTGLGPFGYAEAILNVKKNDTSPVERAVEIWGSERVRSTAIGGSVSGHLESSVKIAFADALVAEVTAVSLEFGTEPRMEVIKALRTENWLHHHGGTDHPNANEIKTRLLRAFYPASDEWKTEVWEQGQEVVHQALTWLGASTPEGQAARPPGLAQAGSH